MDEHECGSSTGSESTELAKADDDDDGLDDDVDADIILLHLSPSMAQGRYDTVSGVSGMVSPTSLVFALLHFQEF